MLQGMLQRSLTPDVVSYCAAIIECELCGRVALDLLEGAFNLRLDLDSDIHSLVRVAGLLERARVRDEPVNCNADRFLYTNLLRQLTCCGALRWP